MIPPSCEKFESVRLELLTWTRGGAACSASGTPHAVPMTAVPATRALTEMERLIHQVIAESDPVTIVGDRGSAVLVSEDDWRAIQETIDPTSTPGTSASIQETRADGVGTGAEEPNT